MTNIVNPERHYKKTPETFSEESRIVSVEKKYYHRGIIFDTPEEFGQAIIFYGDGSVKGSSGSQNHDLNMIGEEHGGMAVGLALLVKSHCQDSETFATRMAKEAVSSLKSNGGFHESNDYVFNSFHMTDITGRRVGDKYVLEICAAYVGSRPEEELAKKMQKPMALVYSSAKARLSIVDDWWFNFNLENIARVLPLSNKDIAKVSEWAMYFSNEFRGHSPEFEFSHEGRKFSLRIGLDADKYLRPEGEAHDSQYMQARGNFIVGAAWTKYDKTGNKKIDPIAVQPAIDLSVSLPGKRYSRPVAVTPQEMEAVRNARDYIANLIPVLK